MHEDAPTSSLHLQSVFAYTNLMTKIKVNHKSHVYKKYADGQLTVLHKIKCKWEGLSVRPHVTYQKPLKKFRYNWYWGRGGGGYDKSCWDNFILVRKLTGQLRVKSEARIKLRKTFQRRTIAPKVRTLHLPQVAAKCIALLFRIRGAGGSKVRISDRKTANLSEIFVVLLSSPKQMPEQHLNKATISPSYIMSSSLFINHAIIRHHAARSTSSVFK
jgi:hypothetical protein